MSYKQALLDLREELFKDPALEAPKPKSNSLVPVRLDMESELKEPKLPAYADWLKAVNARAQEIKESSQKEQKSSGGFVAGLAKTINLKKEEKPPTAAETNKSSLIKRRGDLPSMYAPKDSKAGTFKDLIDIHEGGGDYDTLFQHSQREGGAFAGKKVSEMTLGEVKAFAGARGEGSYYAWSKANMPAHLEAAKKGLGSTPMGRYQFVGSTLNEVANEMGLPDDTVFNAETQDAMFEYYLKKRISRGTTIDEKVAQLRQAWEGFRNVNRDTLANLVVKYGES